jgi:hypothetical protein
MGQTSRFFAGALLRKIIAKVPGQSDQPQTRNRR